MAEIGQVTESAPASAAPPTETASAPSAGAAPSAPAAAAPGATPTPKSDFPVPDSFDFDSWDGEDFNAFPEPIRPWAERFSGYHKSNFESQLESERASLNQMREIYETLMEGREDPRLKSAMDSETKLKKELETWKSKASTYEKEYNEFKTLVEQQARAEAERIANQFKAQNKEIFEDPKKYKVFQEFLNEDWELETIPKLFQLDPEVLEQVRAAKRDGVSDTWALKLAEHFKPKPAKPRAGAELVAGAAAPAPVPQMARSGMGDAMSIDEKRQFAAVRALRGNRS